MADTKKANELGRKLIKIASEIDSLAAVSDEIVKPTFILKADTSLNKTVPLAALMNAKIVDDVKTYIGAQVKLRIKELDKELDVLMPS